MPREAFADALRKGLGRALIHVQRHGMDEVADLVLNACLEDQSYDRQCESSRAPWMFRFFKESTRYEDFRDVILDKLQSTAPSYDLEHLCGLASEMAAKGDRRARESLRIRVLEVARSASDSDSHGARAWIALEGVSGLIELAECYGARLLEDPDDDVPLPIDPAEDGAQCRQALQQHAEHSPAIRAYWNVVEKDLAAASHAIDPLRKARRLTERKQAFPLARLLQMASNKEGVFAGMYSRFGRHASNEEREIVLDRLLREPDEDVRVRLLWVFRRTPLPAVPDAILDWATGPHHDLRAASISALAGTSDPRIHALARSKVESAHLVGADEDTIRLFLENYEPFDAALITRSLASLDPNPDEAHTLASDLSDLASRHRDVNLADALEWAYARTPCTICRHGVVKIMDTLGLLNDTLLLECQFDAADRIRSLAELRLRARHQD